MPNSNNHFCSMRKVRIYLKKKNYLSNINRNITYRIFHENTQYYLEDKITRRFYFSLINELFYYGCHHLIWHKQNDSLFDILKTIAEIKDTDSNQRIKHINAILVNYYSKQPLVIFR